MIVTDILSLLVGQAQAVGSLEPITMREVKDTLVPLSVLFQVEGSDEWFINEIDIDDDGRVLGLYFTLPNGVPAIEHYEIDNMLVWKGSKTK